MQLTPAARKPEAQGSVPETSRQDVQCSGRCIRHIYDYGVNRRCCGQYGHEGQCLCSWCRDQLTSVDGSTTWPTQGTMEKFEKEPSFFAECVAQATRQRILDTVRARVAIARANREANIKYINKQTLKDEKSSSDIKKEKEDVAVTEPQTEPDCQVSQRGCQDEGSGPSSSGSIPVRELVPHHAEHGLQGVPGSVGALTRQEARALQQAQAHQGEDPRVEGQGG